MVSIIFSLKKNLHTVVVQVLGSPEVSIALRRSRVLLPAVLIDLKEFARAISFGSILDLAHVSKNRSPMSTANSLCCAEAIVVLVHLNGDRVTSLERTFSRCCGRVDVALRMSDMHERCHTRYLH
jgi:hypothetical protein